MGNSDHPLHARDAQERGEDAAEADLADAIAVQDLLRRAHVRHTSVEETERGILVKAEPSEQSADYPHNVLARLYQHMQRGGGQFNVLYGRDVPRKTENYWFTRRMP